MRNRIPEELRTLYTRFAEIKKDSFLQYAKGKVEKSFAQEMYESYYRPSFYGFLTDLKRTLYGQNIFELMRGEAKDISDASSLAKILAKSGIAHVQKNGGVALRDESLFEILPRPQSEEEIAQKIEKALGVQIKEDASVANLMAPLVSFRARPELDQLPVSQGSAVFEVKKILEYLPFYGNFLFVGDDDFISILVALADSRVRCIVVDEDEKLLAAIDIVAEKYKLRITTRKGNVQEKKMIGEPIVGFLCNPVYTFEGVKAFLGYGVSHFGKDGGVAMLVVGDEAIGSRFLLLQHFFADKNLLIREVAKGRVVYPSHKSYFAQEPGVEERLLGAGVSRKAIEKTPVVGASVYVFEHIPYKVKPPWKQQSIYTYV